MRLIVFLSIIITTFCVFTSCSLIKDNDKNNGSKLSDNRVWWNNLNETWQIVFLREIDKLDKKPTEEDLVEIINLQSVSCDHFPVGEANLDPLRKLKRLKSISAGSTHINSIDALRDLDSLEFVNFAATSITDIDALQDHENLESVYIQQTLVTDLSPLMGKDKLQVVVFSNTDVNSIQPLMELPLLSIVELQSTRVSQDQINKFKEKHKDCQLGFDSESDSEKPEVDIPLEEEFQWNPGTAPQNKMEDVINGSYWEINICNFQTAFIEDYFNYISQKNSMPVGIQLSNTRLKSLLINNPPFLTSNWVYRVYNSEEQVEKGLSKMLEAGYTPLGMSLSRSDFHFLFAQTLSSCVDWQLVKSDIGFEDSSIEIQTLMDKGYSPVGISIMQNLFYTLMVKTDAFSAKNYSIPSYSIDQTQEVQKTIDRTIENNMLPVGYLEIEDSFSILYIVLR